MATAGEFVGTDFGPTANVAQSTRIEAGTSLETRVDVDRLTGIIALGASAVSFALSAGNFLIHKPETAAVFLGLGLAAAAYGISALFGSRWSRRGDGSNPD